MAQIGNKCPGRAEYHTFESGFCLNECENQCLPASVLVHIQDKARTDYHQGDYISATALLGCMRQLYLERTRDYYVEPPKMWWSLRGSLLHSLLENPPGDLKVPDWLSETVYVYPLGVINGQERYLHGTIDVLRPERGVLIDYKTMGDNGLIGVVKRGAKDQHKRQFNIYRLLVERGYPKGMSYETYKPIHIRRIVAYYMSMMEIVATGGMHSVIVNYQKSEPEKLAGEKIRELLDTRHDLVLRPGKKKATADRVKDYEISTKKKWRLTYEVPEVEFEDLDVVERFVHERSKVLLDAFGHQIMPAMCEPEMRQWKCDGYCADQTREACDAHNETTGEQRIVQIDNSQFMLQEGP